MPPPSQSTRTFFVTSATWNRRAIFQSTPACDLLLALLRDQREKQRMQVHEFVFMPDHFHLLLTPGESVSLEKAMQFIKGGFSFRAKREISLNGEVWQKGFNEHRIVDVADFAKHRDYIHSNPVGAGLAVRPELFPHSSARLASKVDPAPAHFAPVASPAVSP
jgi:putative transposase